MVKIFAYKWTSSEPHRSCIMNRKVGIGCSKYVVVSDRLFISHVYCQGLGLFEKVTGICSIDMVQKRDRFDIQCIYSTVMAHDFCD